MKDLRTPQAQKWADDYLPPETCGAIDEIQNAQELLRDANSQLRHAAYFWKSRALAAEALVSELEKGNALAAEMTRKQMVMLTEARVRVSELEKVLEPFAEAWAQTFGGPNPDDVSDNDMFDFVDPGDFRAAFLLSRKTTGRGEGARVAPRETQATISAWQDSTFGPAVSALSIAWRAQKEMDELIKAVGEDDNHPKAVEEGADIIIVLVRLFRNCGVEFWDVVERVMARNRSRTWVTDGNGHGQHVPDEGATP